MARFSAPSYFAVTGDAASTSGKPAVTVQITDALRRVFAVPKPRTGGSTPAVDPAETEQSVYAQYRGM